MSVYAIYNAGSRRGDRVSGSRVAIRDLRPGGRYYLRDADQLRADIPLIVKEALKDGIVCEEVARILETGLPVKEGR